jgi:hypothetical protein
VLVLPNGPLLVAPVGRALAPRISDPIRDTGALGTVIHQAEVYPPR